MTNINYDYIHKSTEYYQMHGFERVETPWAVTKEIASITKPQSEKKIVITNPHLNNYDMELEVERIEIGKGVYVVEAYGSAQFYFNGDFKWVDDKEDFEIKGKNKVLVASGEQGFLYNYLKNFLPKGKFQTVTPCFRNDSFGVYHTKYFIKNELIITEGILSLDRVEALAVLATMFFENELGLGKDSTELVTYDETNSIDVMHKESKVELGSYGLRECPFLKWIYGTGLAEPRFSIVKNNLQHGLPQEQH